MKLFDDAVKINKESLNKRDNIKSEIKKILDLFEQEKQGLIYGAGSRGFGICAFLTDRGKKIAGFIISDDRKKEDFVHINKTIYHLKEALVDIEKYSIIVAVADKEVIQNLIKYGIPYIEAPNYIFPFIKSYVSILL